MIGRVAAAIRGWKGDGAVALLAASVASWSWWGSTAEDASGIEVAPPEIRLGTLSEGEERTVRLMVSNRRKIPVEVVVTPSCTCTTPDAGPFRLEPGANRSVGVKVSSARRPGFNVANVQIASRGGVRLGQSRITFTAVQPFVFEPPLLFLRGGEEKAVTRAYCLADAVPETLKAVSDDPGVGTAVERVGPRSFDLSVALAGTPRHALASIRVVAACAGGEETLGVVTATVPMSRIGDARVSTVAEAAAPGRLRAWVLVDTEARCPMRVLGVRSRNGVTPAVLTSTNGSAAGSGLWLELLYEESGAPVVVEIEVEVGPSRELVVATLPSGVA
jgi:hypothetical protein